MSRPRILDLFCGAGGAAMGYSRAGFDVVGVDIEPQPHYPFRFIRADAVAALQPEFGVEVDDLVHSPWEFLRDFDAIHASPPCQAYTVLGQSHRNAGKVYPDLLGPTRDLLQGRGLPWIIENVPGAPMRPDYVLCGSNFGMRVRRHRWFEVSWGPVLELHEPCVHDERPVVVSGNNHSGGHTAAEIIDAMQMPWVANRYEVRQAVPPPYTEWLGARLMAHLQAKTPA